MGTKHPSSSEIQLRRGAVLVVLTGIFTLAVAAAMTLYSGGDRKPHTFPNTEGFGSAMVWLELTRSPVEAFAVLGPQGTEQGQAIRRYIDRANRVDFVFLFAYPGLMGALFIFTYLLHRYRGASPYGSRQFVHLGLILVPIMALADALENMQLFAITGAALPEAIPAGTIAALMVWTNIKWIAIFVGSALLGLSTAAYFGFRPGLLGGVLHASAGTLGLLGLLIPGARPLVEKAVGLLAGGWLFSIVHATIVIVRKPGAAQTSPR